MKKSAISDHGLKLLTLNSPKTIKGEKMGIVSGILYLAPARTSGFNVCPNASEGCKAACLFTAGRGAMNKVQAARVRKTLWFFSDRRAFMEALHADITKIVERCTRAKMKPAIRLNGTSDILWHRVTFRNYPNIHAAFPNVQFYDYTKQDAVKFSGKPPNLHVTFSRSEDNEAQAIRYARTGMTVAVVFRNVIPATWHGFPVHDADETDLRFFDPIGSIAGLRAKGKAKKDKTGFVLEGVEYVEKIR